MSKDYAETTNFVTTTYAGPSVKGKRERRLQITAREMTDTLDFVGFRHIQLTKADARELSFILSTWGFDDER